MRKHYYIIGKVYGVQKLLKIKKKNNKSIAVVKCIYCHKIKEILPYLLFNKKYNSCICQTKKVNGLSSSKIYSIYHNMKYRCYNKNHTEFHNYGGKGIKVDDQWLGNNGFNNFFKGFWSFIWFLILCTLIFYQLIITFFFPLRWNICILLIEIFLLFFILYRIIWPY